MVERIPQPLARLMVLTLVADGVRRITLRWRRSRAPGSGGPAVQPAASVAGLRGAVGGLEVALGLATLERMPLAPRTVYRVLAPAYDQMTPLWRDWLHRDASRALDVALRAWCPSGGRVLDLGCGTGAVLERLVATGTPFASYIGVDQSAAMLERARAKLGALPSVRFEQLDLRHDPLPVGPFDLVTSAWALEHLRDPGRVVASAAERLRPGGRLVLFFEADGQSWRERAFRQAWQFFGARLVPEREYAAWPGVVSIRRFPGLSPSVVLAILTRRPELP